MPAPNTSPRVPRLVIGVVALLCVFTVLGLQKNFWWSLDPGQRTADTKYLDAKNSARTFRERVQFFTDGTAVKVSKKNGGGSATDNELTKKRVLELAPDGFLLVTMGNRHFLPLIVNWVYHVEKLDISSYVVACMDEHLKGKLDKLNISNFDLGSALPSEDFGWGTANFHKLGSVKVKEILMVLEMGVNVIFTDADAIWLRNPIPFWKENWEADVLMSTDALSSDLYIDGLLDDPSKHVGANIGILMFKPSAKYFVREWQKVLIEKEIWDQEAFHVMKEEGQEILDRDVHVFKAFNGTLSMGYLPIIQFCPGHVFFAQQLPKKSYIYPYAIHTTFQNFGTPGKRHRFREWLLWDDPPEYFDSPKGFLLFDLDIPDDLLENAAPKFPDKIWLNDTVGHFALVNHQVIQIRKAFSIARVLNRILVMPELWCGQDYIHYPHPGVPSGVDMTLPFQCPMDHVFNAEVMVPMPDEDGNQVIEPFIEIRESSFLRNKRLPLSVRSSVLRVDVCKDDDSDCGKEEEGAVRGEDGHPDKLHLKSNLSEVGIKKALGNLMEYKFLHFSTMLDAFGGFENPEAAEEFKNGTKDYMGQWCCVKEGPVVYDLFPDIIPHTDSRGRVFNTTWEPRVVT
ncbi:hypothetical protein BSKO_12173 [Bryopsis sp. KO-2023]|nr:hypothetical protein BSKO_12173 [Bryopsis sp. KO-2023]